MNGDINYVVHVVGVIVVVVIKDVLIFRQISKRTVCLQYHAAEEGIISDLPNI